MFWMFQSPIDISPSTWKTICSLKVLFFTLENRISWYFVLHTVIQCLNNWWCSDICIFWLKTDCWYSIFCNTLNRSNNRVQNMFVVYICITWSIKNTNYWKLEGKLEQVLAATGIVIRFSTASSHDAPSVRISQSADRQDWFLERRRYIAVGREARKVCMRKVTDTTVEHSCIRVPR